jgi:hypothetical protein
MQIDRGTSAAIHRRTSAAIHCAETSLFGNLRLSPLVSTEMNMERQWKQEAAGTGDAQRSLQMRAVMQINLGKVGCRCWNKLGFHSASGAIVVFYFTISFMSFSLNALRAMNSAHGAASPSSGA